MSIERLLKDTTNEMAENRYERRKLIQMGLAGGAALFGGSLLAGCGGNNDSPVSGASDADILNFALNLEYLEAEFYLRAVTGSGLSAADAGAGAGAVAGGAAVPFTTSAFQQYAQEIAADELAHVRFLRAALGTAAVSRPAIDFSNGFRGAGMAAGLGSSFDPFLDEVSFMLGAFVFEDVGVTAYKGAAASISSATFLEAAAGILGVEAYHAGTVRTVLYSIGGSAITSAQAISDLRDSVDGGDDLDQGIQSGGNANIVPTDANGIAFSRIPDQVLRIVYLGGTDAGGFYPDGLNGNIA